MGDDYPYPVNRYLLLGKTGKAHGLRGEIRIHCYSGDGGALAVYRELVFCDRAGNLTAPMALLSSRRQGQGAIARIASVQTRQAAERYEGLAVLVARDDLPAVAEGEYYWHKIAGKMVKTVGGRTVGRVDRLFSNGAQDILVVVEEGEEILIPMTREIVVEESEEELLIDPPPGLLEINAGSTEPTGGRATDDL